MSQQITDNGIMNKIKFLYWLSENKNKPFRVYQLKKKFNEFGIDSNYHKYLLKYGIINQPYKNGPYRYNKDFKTKEYLIMAEDIDKIYANENLRSQFQSRTYYSLQKKMKYIEWVIDNKNTFFAYDEFRAKCTEIGISTTYCDILYRYGLLKKGERMTFTFNEDFRLKDILSMAIDTYHMERQMRMSWRSEKKRKEKVKSRKSKIITPLTITKKEAPKKSIVPVMTLVAIIILCIILIVKL